MGIVAEGAHAFQGHVTCALGGPFVGRLEENGADEAEDDGLVGTDADDIGAAPLPAKG